MMTLHMINWLAVVAAAVATFVIGALWYSPALFAKQWQVAHGYSADKLQAMKKTMPQAFMGSFVCYLFIAAALAALMVWTGRVGLVDGLKLAFLCWAGFAATLGLTANLYSDNSRMVFVIDAAYQLVFFLVMGAILGVWR
ncbi:MAG: DUF1761 domain-containing protein [Rhodospirillales bacterium]